MKILTRPSPEMHDARNAWQAYYYTNLGWPSAYGRTEAEAIERLKAMPSFESEIVSRQIEANLDAFEQETV